MTKDHRTYHFIVCLFVLFVSTITPQKNKIKFEHLSLEHGLSSNGVFCIIQDRRGFMWFATFDGLNKYDGYSITEYKSDPHDLQSLSDNKVSSIIEDQNGVIWVGSYGGGLDKFDREKETFTRYSHDPKNPNSLGGNGIITIYEDRAGMIWIGTFNALNKFDKESETFTHYKHNPGDPKTLGKNEVVAIFEDRSRILWIGTNGGGLNKFDRKNETFEHYEYDPNDPFSLGNNRIHSIFEDRSGVMWIGTNDGGLNKFDREKEIFTRYKHNPNNPNSISSNFVGDIYEDQSGVMWIGTNDGGLSKFDREKETFTHYKHDPSDAQSLSHNRVLSFCRDQSGVLWIGTDGGLNKLIESKKYFTHYNHDPSNPKSLSNNWVNSIIEDQKDQIWIGTFGGGINEFNRDSETFTHYKHDPNNPNSLSDDRVVFIHEDHTGVIWIGTLGGGLNKFDPGKKTFTHFRHDPNNPKSISEDEVITIYEDRTGVIWIATDQQGLNKFDREMETFTRYKNDPNDSKSLSGNEVIPIYEDRSGVLWFGTGRNGLNKFDRENDTFINFKHDPNDPTSLSYNTVSSIYENKSGVLWLGTYGAGLNRFIPETETFEHFNEKDGLADHTIYGILEDEHRNLWISTNKGLSKFNLDTKKTKNYNITDGLQDNQFEQGAYLKTKSGEFYFGGINGFNVFHPDSIKDNPYIPQIVITDFQLFSKSVPVGLDTVLNRTILNKSITETEEIELTHEDNTFSFEFAALDYTNPVKNKYAYKLEDLDDEWIYTDASRRFATYTNLDPGEYIFRVKGSNNDGIWNEEGASIRIIILPPWWKTNWAYLIYMSLIIGSIYLFWKLQMRRIKLKQEYDMSKFEAKKLHEIDELKSHFFANISHEFRTPLTLILGPVKEFISKENDSKKKEELSVVYRNADRLNELVNQLLDLSKLEAGKMSLQTSALDMIPLLKGLVLSFASLAERKKIQLNFNSQLSKLEVYLDQDKFEKIINNLLSNAFKFTPENGVIEINVGTFAESVEIKIADTGIGISENRLENIFDRFYQVDGSHTREQEGTGIGLALTKELVELHKGKITVESEEEKGTTFTVILPLGKAHLKSDEISEEMEESEKITSAVDNLILESQPQEEKLDIKLYTETEKPLILIVEDNTDVRNYIKGYLNKEYRLLEAKDGEEGLEKSFEHIPDLIVSDVMMPKMDGFLLCEKLKTDDRTSHIPLILLTAKASGQDKIEGLETGADDYIMKPFDAKELQIRVKNLIKQRKKIIEHFRKQELFDTSNLQITSRDKKFISKAIEIINNHISNENFDVNNFAKEIGLSRVQLHRKLTALTGQTSSDLIRIIKLTKAAKLIQSNFGNISEIALEVGFSNPANFAKAFHAHFGVSPSNYKKNSFTP